MRLLVVTQAVDLDDPILGFFHRWVAEFAKHCDSIEVICLKEGAHDLPKNVQVHSLGKERGVSRVKYVLSFYRYVWKLRGDYDAVFVHMNQEYVLLAGLLWKTLGKKVVLWRNHQKGTWRTRLAAMLADTVCYTSPAAYVAQYKNAVIMPIGIDTDFFRPAAQTPPADSILFFGRLDPVKRPDVFIDALHALHEKGVAFTADIVGDPTPGNEQYAHDIRNRATPLALDGTLRMLPGVTNVEARGLFASHAIYVNLTPSGSFDKTIGEAMACGCIVVVVNEALKGVAPDTLVVNLYNKASIEMGIQAALGLEENERINLQKIGREYIEKEHALIVLTLRIMGLFGSHN